MDFTYYSAVYSVENALAKVKDEKGMQRVEKFLHEAPCPDCGGKRYSADAERILWTPKKSGSAYSLPELMAMTVDDALEVFAENKKISGRRTAGRHSTDTPPDFRATDTASSSPERRR